MYTVKDFLAIYGPFEKWMLKAVEVANQSGDVDLKTVGDKVKEMPQYKQHVMNESPCPVYINLDQDDDESLKDNYAQVVETISTLAYLPTVEKAAIMPDACSAGAICVGGVVAANNAIHPAFHSADVCCSMYLTEFSTDLSMEEVLDVSQELTHFGPTQRNVPVELPESLVERIKSNPYTKPYLHIAQRDMATQGDGNHFLFLGNRESTGNPCIVTHHGSRGFGAKVFKAGLKTAQEFAKHIAPKGMPKQYAWIPMETQEGEDYWGALQIVREWTYHNHKAIHEMIMERVSNDVVDSFWNEHNFVFKRDNWYYHAKGATPGWNDTYHLTLVPMNMAEPILMTRGTEVENGIGFLPHGAGRNMSRTKFKEIFPNPTLPEGIDIRSYSGELDATELPQAYKNAEEVERQMKYYNLATVEDRVLPYGCIMAGEIEIPWKE